MHEVLLTLCKIIAPVVPFLSEVMWKNLMPQSPPTAVGGLSSVHLADYPTVDDSLVDKQLSDDTAALLRLVTHGSAVRNLAKQKVRQPLAELLIQSNSQSVVNAVVRFEKQIEQELNVRKIRILTSGSLAAQPINEIAKSIGNKNSEFTKFLVQLCDAVKSLTPSITPTPFEQFQNVMTQLQPLLQDALPNTQPTVGMFMKELAVEVNKINLQVSDAKPLLQTAKLNKKTAAKKLGPHLAEAEQKYLRTDAHLIAEELVAHEKVAYLDVDLTSEDFVFEFRAPPGWAGIADKDTQVLLDTRITPELKAEGLARDLVRFVQEARKRAGLDVADQITLFLGTESEVLKQAIEAHRATIAADAQVAEWLDAPPADGHNATVKVDGQSVTIGVRKV